VEAPAAFSPALKSGAFAMLQSAHHLACIPYGPAPQLHLGSKRGIRHHFELNVSIRPQLPSWSECHVM
jgi:hypothetical protein